MQEAGHLHLHINHFPIGSDESLPTSVRLLSERYGFLSTKCKIRREDGTLSPLWIVTKKVPARKIAESIFQTASESIRKDPDMNGYIECETLPHGNVARFPEMPYTPQNPFPMFGRPSFARVARGADIHIFRNGSAPYDSLDTELKEVGFYEVLSPTQRIWTLLLQDRETAEAYFNRFKRYLAKTGGATRVEMEIVEHLTTAPPTFRLLPVVATDQPPFPPA